MKVIIFDIDNTLLSFDEYVKISMKEGFEKFKIGTYKDEMYGVFCNINNSLWEAIERCEIDFEELQKIRWNMIFKELGFNADGIKFEKYFRESLNHNAILIDGAEEIVKYLKDKYILCVASNGPYNQQINRLKICGLYSYFSDFFISEEIGSSNPSKSFFDICIKRLNEKYGIINREEIMIVGDSVSSDMAGGINSGMKTCFYNPNNKKIPSDMRIDYNVKSLYDLKAIL